ncbi:hypothetical protein CL653_03560 [bacterium]|nr:hypothetical protein [bacterium]|tara:strand:- start:1600 stop:1782 length:183 start_codon:yes stop_codon:yes gene_type:complete
MHEKQLRKIVEERLLEILQEDLADASEWEDQVIEKDLEEDDVIFIVEEIIPNCQIKITID